MRTAQLIFTHRIRISDDARYLTVGQVRERFRRVRHVGLAPHAAARFPEAFAVRRPDERPALASHRHRTMGARARNQAIAGVEPPLAIPSPAAPKEIQ